MRTALALLLIALGTASVEAQPRLQVTKDQLKAEYAGICKNPDATFPKPMPEEKKAAFAAWCGCVEQSIDGIPEEKLQQAAEETFREYAEYKNDPRGFVPTGEYSMIRISKSCVKK